MEMRKICLFLYFISILLVIGFFIILGIDYSKYNDSQSAPFYITVITRGVEFIFPSVILLIISKILKKKY